jgi:hypothetical protein
VEGQGPLEDLDSFPEEEVALVLHQHEGDRDPAQDLDVFDAMGAVAAHDCPP